MPSGCSPFPSSWGSPHVPFSSQLSCHFLSGLPYSDQVSNNLSHNSLLLHSTLSCNLALTCGKICVTSSCPPVSQGKGKLPVALAHPCMLSAQRAPRRPPARGALSKRQVNRACPCSSPSLRRVLFLGNYLFSWAFFPFCNILSRSS